MSWRGVKTGFSFGKNPYRAARLNTLKTIEEETTMAKANESKNDVPVNKESVSKPQGTPVKWTTTDLKSSYANFCNANSTREEVVLNFGVNKAWERGPKSELEIELNHRIVLSPFAAKRLSQLMQQLIKEYEQRYGALSEGSL